MAMGMGPQAGHEVYIRRVEDENCCNLARCNCKIIYYIVFSVLGVLAGLFVVLAVISGLLGLILLAADLVILGIVWGTFCCAYGCCCSSNTNVVVQSAAAQHVDPASAHMHPQPVPVGAVHQGYPVHVHHGYPVSGQPAPPSAPAQPWPQPSNPPGPKPPMHTTPAPYPPPYPQTQPGSSSWQAPPGP